MDESHPKAFVTGWPVDQSLSPHIHRYWLQFHGLAGDYVKKPCEPDNIEDFLRNLKEHGFVGGNVTIPHKEAAFKITSHLNDAAKALGAVNTVWLENGELHGANTDGIGFLKNLDHQVPEWDSAQNLSKGALVLGAGGAARAVIYSLVERGFSKVTIANRTVERAKALAAHFGDRCFAADINNLNSVHHQACVVVNTTSIGMGDGQSPIDLNAFGKATVVSDIVYKPLETPLLAQAKALGMTPVDGLGMLLHQAVPGFEKWFGIKPDVTPELRDLLIRQLERNQ